MGKLEEISKKRRRKSEVQKAILQSIAVAGILTVAMTSTNALQLLKALSGSKRDRRIESINRSRQRLIQAGKLKYENGHLALTPKGETVLHRLEFEDFKLKKPKKWDKKWRILIFDIPEKRRMTRDKVRNTLRVIGFFRIQDSVWVYPYDCEDLITLLKADFKIGKDLLYLIVDTVENDSTLLDNFDLDR